MLSISDNLAWAVLAALHFLAAGLVWLLADLTVSRPVPRSLYIFLANLALAFVAIGGCIAV